MRNFVGLEDRLDDTVDGNYHVHKPSIAHDIIINSCLI